ncbi:MAG: tetratricopeptide repeat protein [Candidatus Sigynarchaeota archaeon]
MTEYREMLAISPNDLLSADKKYTFLVGAGISMNAPSNLPSARTFTRILLGAYAPAEELDRLLSIEALRYEFVVEQIQSNFDPGLHFLDYLDVVSRFNAIHAFLARAIKNGHYVVTTNFDYLIERALVQLLPAESRAAIVPVISKSDFIKYPDPSKLFEERKYPLYKIHGSKRNIITGEETADSLVTTISALGRDRENNETFAVEAFKKPAVKNLLKGRHLVVAGYSGSDDFDIGPVLKEFQDFASLIWIEHTSQGSPEIFKIKPLERPEQVTCSSRTDKMLLEIRSDVLFDVYKISGNTNDILSGIPWNQDKVDPAFVMASDEKGTTPQPMFQEWFKPLNAEDEVMRYRLAVRIYTMMNMFDDAIRCGERGLAIAAGKGIARDKSMMLNELAVLNEARGEYAKAEEFLNESAMIDKASGDLRNFCIKKANLAYIVQRRGDNTRALALYQEAIDGADQLNDASLKASWYNNIGMLYEDQGDIDKATEQYAKAIEHRSKTGDLECKANAINNLGLALKKKGEYEKALSLLVESCKIDEQLGNFQAVAKRLNNIAVILMNKGQFDESMDYLQKAIDMAEKIGDHVQKAKMLGNRAAIYLKREETKRYPDAIKDLQESIAIAERMKDMRSLSTRYNNLAMLHQGLGQVDLAKEYLGKVIEIAEKTKDLNAKAIALDNLATMYLSEENKETALRLFKEASAILEGTGDVETLALLYDNIGITYGQIGDLDHALEFLTKGLHLQEKRAFKPDIAEDHYQIGKVYLKLEKPDLAADSFVKAMELDTNTKYAEEYARACETLGDLSFSKENIDEAIDWYKKADVVNVRLYSFKATARSSSQLALLYGIKNDRDQAMNYFEKAADAAEKAKNFDLAIDLWNKYKQLAVLKNDHEKILIASKCMIGIQRKAGKKESLLDSLKEIGELYIKNLRPLRAIVELKEALTIASELGNVQETLSLLKKIGEVYEMLKQPGKALIVYTEAMKVAQKKNETASSQEFLERIKKITQQTK